MTKTRYLPPELRAIERFFFEKTTNRFKMLGEIQKFFNKRLLKKRPKPIKRKPLSLEHAQWIGVLFDATSIEHIEATTKYVEQLRKEGKQVRLLAYVDDKSKEIALPFPYFSKNDVNLFHIPSSNTVENFITQTFDILFVLHPKSTSLFEYIATLTDARLKVGPFSNDKNTFDFMVDMSGQSALHYFINQVEFFLAKMKPQRNAQIVEQKQLVEKEELVAA